MAKRIMPGSNRREKFARVPEGRRRIMRAIRSADTLPERMLRAQLHAAGFRFRKNVRGLPGKPDIVFGARKKVIFVHGCFWHAHKNCYRAAVPRTRTRYWKAKLNQNVIRDRKNIRILQRAGWQIYVVWECEVERVATHPARLLKFLGPPKFLSRDRSSALKRR